MSPLQDEHQIEATLDAKGAIELTDPLPPRAEPLLCLALGLAREDGPLIASGAGQNGTEVVAVWSAPYWC